MSRKDRSSTANDRFSHISKQINYIITDPMKIDSMNSEKIVKDQETTRTQIQDIQK